jgi:hypothetical protein
VKMRVLGCQLRRRKDRGNSTYCRRKKIQAGTVFQDSPPAIVADCLQPLLTTQMQCSCRKKRRSLALHFLLDRGDILGQLERQQVSCHSARPCISERLPFCAGLQGIQARRMPFSNFCPLPFGGCVQFVDAGVEMRSLGERERVSQLIQAEKRAGFCSPMTSMQRGTQSARLNQERGPRW